MKVFYTVPYSGKQKYQAYYDLVLQAIENCGVEVISPEKGNYQRLVPVRARLKLAQGKLIHYEAIRKGINLADAVVMEVTHPNFQVGWEAALAAITKKPILLLSLEEDYTQKINNLYVFGAKYTKLTLDEIVEQFITRAKRSSLGERFNCFLSEDQLKYLDKASRDQGVNKSEYLRKLIDMDRSKG